MFNNSGSELADALKSRKNKKKKFVDSEGKEWDLAQFDETKKWSKPKKE